MRSKVKDATAQIEAANAATDQVFIDSYLQPSDGWTTWKHPKTDVPYTLSLHRTGNMTRADLDACLALIDQTSGQDYRGSSVGWHPSSKKEEMDSPDLRYTLVKDEQGCIVGFTSIMPTFEEGDPVVYCYEIHLSPILQGSGLGKKLMQDIERVAQNIDCMEKVMLTCFVSNKNARAFYDKLGFEVDECSPRDRKLRGNKVIKADIVIMSKLIKRRQRETNGNEHK